MNQPTTQALTDDEINALLDEQGSGTELAALRVRLALDPTAQATLLKWQQQRLALKQLYQHVHDEAIPDSLHAAASGASAAPLARRSGARWGAMAAGVLMSFGLGWLSHTAWQWDQGGARLSAQARMPLDFARQARVAHVVYSPEQRHPVEVGAQEQDHLVQWLSKRLGQPLKVPQLSPLGYELVGGRLLPGDSGARAQFMFQDASGQRVTLYLGAMAQKTGDNTRQDTAFSYRAEQGTASFYWVDKGMGYALTGPLPRTQLLALAESIYQQL